MHSSKTCEALSSQYDSVLFLEKSSKIVFKRLAKIEGFKFGLCKGLYLYFPFNSIVITSLSLPNS